MEPHVVLARTAQGADALARQDHALPRTLRHALILVDGHATVEKLEQRGAMIPEFGAALRELVARGLVAPVGHAFAAANGGGAAPGTNGTRTALVRLAEGILGDKSAKVVRKLQDAGASPVELTVAVDSCYKLIRLTIDEKAAEEFRAAARQALAKGK
jgi:hypothetical protein